ncbi:hypothetical protein LNA02_09090 [Levilactobacillus namurensis]|nr:hypothetical protein LNA02_09090 [Levilactobacillus namurensis]
MVLLDILQSFSKKIRPFTEFTRKRLKGGTNHVASIGHGVIDGGGDATGK